MRFCWSDNIVCATLLMCAWSRVPSRRYQVTSVHLSFTAFFINYFGVTLDNASHSWHLWISFTHRNLKHNARSLSCLLWSQRPLAEGLHVFLVNSNCQTSILDSTFVTLYLLQPSKFDNLKRTLLIGLVSGITFQRWSTSLCSVPLIRRRFWIPSWQ